LQPHPEGGHYRETYRSSVPVAVAGAEVTDMRPAGTAIYFLLCQGDKSRLHRLRFDEIWHFYLGGPLRLVVISESGQEESFTLGSNLVAGHKLQHVVPAGSWFGAYPLPGSAYSLVGCTVAPGFAFQDFTLGEHEKLLELYPHLRQTILQLT